MTPCYAIPPPTPGFSIERISYFCQDFEDFNTLLFVKIPKNLFKVLRAFEQISYNVRAWLKFLTFRQKFKLIIFETLTQIFYISSKIRNYNVRDFDLHFRHFDQILWYFEQNIQNVKQNFWDIDQYIRYVDQNILEILTKIYGTLIKMVLNEIFEIVTKIFHILKWYLHQNIENLY